VKIAIISDLHFGARGDSVAHRTYIGRFFSEVFFPYIDANNIDRVINLGDTFDKRQTINFATLSAANECLFVPLKNRFIEYTQIVGNHDAFYRDSLSINSPELLLRGFGFDIVSAPQIKVFDGLRVLLVPWITEENREATIKLMAAGADHLFGHLEVNGFEISRGSACDHGMDGATLGGFRSVLSGHFHIRATRGNITYVGTPYQLTWEDHGQQKGFHVFDTGTGELEFVPNPLELFRVIEYDDSGKVTIPADFDGGYVKVVVRKRTDPVKFDRMMSYLNGVGLTDLTVVDTETAVADVEVSASELSVRATLDIIMEVVESTDVKVDRGPLLDELSSIYAEAVAQ